MKIFLRAENNEDLERIVRYNIGKAHQIRKELSILKELPNKNCIVTEPVMESVDLVQVECKEKEINEEYLYYYTNLLEDLNETKTEEDKKIAIARNLPTIDNKNYVNIINRIKLELLKGIHDLEELKELETDNDFISEIEKEKLDTQSLIHMIQEVQTEKVEIDSVSSSITKNNLVFLQSHSGSTYAENDLYSIAEEYYESFKDLILSIEDGTFKNVKRFSKNNNILKGISEVKDFKTRVIFDRIDKNTYVIIDIFVKKTDNDNGYRDALNSRVDYYKKVKPMIIEQIKDEKYLEYHREIRDNLISGLTEKNIIKTMKRG